MRNTPLKAFATPLKHGKLKDFQKGTKGHNPDTMSADHEDYHLKQSEKQHKDPKK